MWFSSLADGFLVLQTRSIVILVVGWSMLSEVTCFDVNPEAVRCPTFIIVSLFLFLELFLEPDALVLIVRSLILIGFILRRVAGKMVFVTELIIPLFMQSPHFLVCGAMTMKEEFRSYQETDPELSFANVPGKHRKLVADL